MLNVGLTGGIASGKSTVARMFEKRGACVIDFDLLARKVEEPGQPAWESIIDFFGREILNEDETIDREKLASIVFRDGRELAKLSEIVHPIIFEEWGRRIAALEKKKPGGIVISDIPLLIETGAQKSLDLVLLVHVSPALQVERLMARNGLSRETALSRINSQLPIDDKVPHADIVIDNSFSLEKTEEKVDEVWRELNKRKREKNGPSPSVAPLPCRH